MSATALAIIGGIGFVTVTAILVSQKAQTSSVLQSASGFATQIIQAAVSPVTGTSPTVTFGSNAVNAQGVAQ